MNASRYQDLPETTSLAAKRSPRWRRRGGSRLDKVIERNARWVAEARSTPPLYALDAA